MEEIIQSLLTEIQRNPEVPVEETIKSLLQGMVLTPEDITEISDAFTILDTINENAVDLSKKRKEGMTRNGWVQEKLSNLDEHLNDYSDKVNSQIEQGIKEAIDINLLENE